MVIDKDRIMSKVSNRLWLNQDWDIILASQSPRRRDLLRGLGLVFRQIAPIDVDESYPYGMKPDNVASYLSRKKAEAYLPYIGRESLLITADTTVILEQEILGKPKDILEAKYMLGRLQGQSHYVVTAISLCTLEKIHTVHDKVKVTFLPLDQMEIDYYLDQYKPLDKAGAYGIQEWIGYRAIESIEGSFYTVMGLPTHLLVEELKRFVL